MTEPSALDSAYSWRRLMFSLLIAIIGNVGMWASIVVLPAMQAEFGLDRGDASLPYTFTMFGYALGNLLIGRIVDRYGATTALICAALISGIGFTLTSMTGQFWLVCALQLAIGFATAACFGPLIADISLWFMKRRGIAVGIAASGNYLSGVVWPVVLAGILEHQGWRAAYLVLAVISVAGMIPLAMTLRRRLPEEAAARSDAASAERAQTAGFAPGPLTLLLFLAGVGCCVAMSMPQVHIVAYCIDLGYGPAAGGQMLSLMLLGGVVSRLVSGAVADRLGGVRTLLIGSFLQFLALILYLPSGGLTSLYLVSLVFGLSQGGIVPSYAVIVREFLPARQAGARVGFVIMGTILGMALGGWMSGWIYDVTGSYRMAFLNGIAFNALNLGIMLLILLRATRRPVLA
ncbi:MFS transporter [Pseudooceanicola sp. 216_PA32_1]|uniref:MFS transporter n=1 Tax=Pseudooceanicola pacificus TaxID=2676438 RepID=A0A844WBA6_9RHOB|nr:MFS transporter [Pseudooceanicola pacificus]MWB76530.1 MFS transporter [Pseudooceanicola pacificus]